MKRIILIAEFLILLSPFLVLAETKEISDFDGNEWRTWDLSRRADFISGFLAGTSYVTEENTPSFGFYMGKDYDAKKAFEVFRDYKALGLEQIKGEPKAKVEAKPDQSPAPQKPRMQQYTRDEVSLLLEREYRKSREWLTHYSIIGITNGQIVDGLNLFYDDFRNRHIKLPDAIYIIRKQILGASKEEIEAIMEWRRNPNRDSNKLIYKDKEGNLKLADFP